MSLVVRVGERSFALPIAVVVETMRPLPIVDRTSVVRGAAIPIIDAAALAGVPSAPTRLVVLRAGDARVGVLVDAVLGVRAIATAGLVEPA